MEQTKIAFFVEGQGEQVFLRNILFHLLDPSIFSFECLKLHAGKLSDVPYKQYNPSAYIHFLIINVENDSRVLSAIKEREEQLIRKGFVKIIGLRDMYSQEYDKKAKGKIEPNITKLILDKTENIISSMKHSDMIRIHFSIMEIEAWWLSMYSIFRKIHRKLEVDFIKDSLNYQLNEINTETTFYRPSFILDNILNLVEMSYKKKLSDVEKITSKIDKDDIKNGISNNRCNRFKMFCKEITDCGNNNSQTASKN